MKSILMIVWSFFSGLFPKKKDIPHKDGDVDCEEGVPSVSDGRVFWLNNWASPAPPNDGDRVRMPGVGGDETVFGQSWARPMPPVDIPGNIRASDIVPEPPPRDPILDLWGRCMRHMSSNGMVIDSQIGGGNIIFVSGYGLDGRPNDDRPNKWNDLCFVARNTPSGWVIPFAAECTTSPGSAPSLSKDALDRGGIACIVPGQYFAWMLGYHKEAVYGTSHPAFVQRKVVSYTRDFNQDLSPIGDKVHSGVIGANIHAQGEGKDADNVNYNSEGCLVLRHFEKLQELRSLAKDFNIYKENGKATIFAGTIIKGSDLPN